MKNTTIIIVLGILTIFAYECNNSDEAFQQRYSALQQTNQELSKDIAVRDAFVDSVTSAINDIYTNIEDLALREKALLKETTKLESEKKLTRDETHTNLNDRIRIIRAALIDDHKRLTSLQSKLNASKTQYTGLEKIVDNLEIALKGRDSSIADLGEHIQGLEQEVSDKNSAIAQKDSVIDTQYKQISTAYYITGTKDQLEKMGIISKEGGFPWGLFGSTTMLTSSFDEKYFKPINKLVDNTIHVDGKIDEILPKRNADLYSQVAMGNERSMLTISQPNEFWKEKYLVIITDKPTTN